MKKTALILITCLILSCTTGFAFEKNSRTDRSNSSKIINVLAEQGGFEFDGFQNENVSRGEFVNILTDLITCGKTLTDDCEFEDVESGSKLSHSLSYAVNIGIVSKAKNFSPNSSLTKTAAVKMAVCALGYRVKAELTGGYPTGYISIAKKIELNNDLNNIDNEAISVEEAYILLENMLRCNLYEAYEIDGGYMNYSESDKTFLSSVYDIEFIEGIVKADAYTSLTDASAGLGKNRIRIDTTDANYYGKEDFLGKNVRAYIKDSDGICECVCIEEYNTTSVNFCNEDYVNTQNGMVELETQDGKSEKFRLDSAVKYIFNRKAIGARAAEALLSNYEYSVTLIDADENNVYETVIIKQYTYCLVNNADIYDGIIIDENDKQNKIIIPTDADEYSISGTYDGKEISKADDLEQGMLLAVVKNSDDVATDIIVCDNQKNVRIALHDKTDSKIEDAQGNKYTYGAYFEKYYESKILLGSDARLFFGINGEIVAGEFKQKECSYGWIVARENNTGGIKDKSKIKVFTEKGKMEYLTVSDKFTLNGAKPTVTVEDMVDTMSQSDRLIKYTINSDGEIKNIDTAKTFDGSLNFPDYSNVYDSLTLFYNGYGKNTRYKKDTLSFNDSFGIGNAVVFSIPLKTEDLNDDKLYSIKSGSGLLNDRNYQVNAYDFSESLEAGAIAVFENSDNLSDVTSNGVVVTEIYEALNQKGDSCYSVTVCDNGTYSKLYSTDRNESVVKTLSVGDIIRISTNGDEIKSIKREYSCQENKIINSYSSGADVNWICGYVYDIQNGSMSIASGISDVSQVTYNKLINVKMGSQISYIYVTKGSDGKIKSAVVRPSLNQNIKGTLLSGSDASYVVIQRRYYASTRTFIYIYE